MIMQTPESDLRTLFNLIEQKLRALGTHNLTIFKMEHGYKIMEGTPDMGTESHLKIIGIIQYESIEAALAAYILSGEVSAAEEFKDE
jgi:hypothetical protein